MRRAFWALLVLVLLVAAACSSALTGAAPESGSGEGAIKPGAPPANTVPSRDSSFGTSPEQGIPSLVAVGRDLILTASITFRSQDPWTTADQARAIAAGVGGDLLSLSQGGSGDQRSALLTIRVPSSRFDDALSQLKRLEGEVLTSNVDAKDVTDQFVDVQARLGAKKAEEQQYLALLGRANTVDEILKVQSALGSVRVQIEQLQAQVNSLKSRIDYSTITMQISPLVTIGGQTGTWDPARTFAQALAAMGVLLRSVGDAAIWMFVFLWIPLLALALVFAATRIRRVPAA
jgi:hypothetical protein